MSDPTSRILELLSLLQTHRHWKGSELAARLGVTERTVRRDIDRLRELRYPVDAETGSAGGYRLAVGAHLPPLVVNDEEAVALVIGLRSAAVSAIDGTEAATVGLLAKLDRVLPDRVRRRVASLASNLEVMVWAETGPSIGVAALTTLSQACSDSEEVRFSYERRDGETSERLVRPHSLVASGRRWYLVAWDLRREDWRTFRLDRMAEVRVAGARFAPMELPGEGAAEFVRRGMHAMSSQFEVTLEVSGSTEDLDSIASRVRGDTEVVSSNCIRLRLQSESLEWLAALVGMVAIRCEFSIVDAPDELGPLLAAAGNRLIDR